MEGNINTINFSDRYLLNLLQGNRHECSAIAKQYLELNPSFIDLYEEVFKVSLYEIGRLWETNRISVATEHLATAITEGILNEFFEQLISEKRLNRKVVVACVEHEKHQVGAKMVADTFEMHGWESYFPGTGVPLQELVRYIHELKPDLIAISLSVYFNFASLLQMIGQIRKEFPDTQLIVGGQAFTELSPGMLREIGTVVILPDLYLLQKFILFLNSKSLK